MYKINTYLKLQPNKEQSCNTNLNYQNQSHSNSNSNNSNNLINEDISKLHLLPQHCPMTPKSYTDFFNYNQNNNQNNRQLSGVSLYKLEKVKHPREGYKYTMEYNNFYTDWNKDALQYTSSNNEFLDTNNKNKINPIIINDESNKNIILYKETKPHHEFARPMKMNGSNKVEDLFDNCMNKKTFEYKRYSSISPHHKQYIDNPIFTGDISEETTNLKNNYMNNIDEDNMNIYSSVFEDMYYLTNNTANNNYKQSEYKNYNYLKKLEEQIKNTNILEDDNIQKIKQENIQKLDNKLDNRNILRSEFIKPIRKYKKY